MPTGTVRPPSQARDRALGGDRARDDQLAVLDLAADVLDLLGHPAAGLDDERALDGGLVGARADAGGVGPAAEQQPQPGDHHRLARTGLAGDHGEARRKLQDGLVDDAEPLDADLLDSGSHWPTPVTSEFTDHHVRSNAWHDPTHL